jgi:hypothetical protein
MADKPAGSLVQLHEVRERTIELLSGHYANDVIDVDELERRVGLAETALSVAELEELVADLGPVPSPTALAVEPARSETALARPEDVEQSKSLVAIFGGTSRKGVWTVPRKLNVTAVLGGADLDFREAKLAPGVTEVKVFTFLGGTDIIVPPNLRVEVDGTGILGGFDDHGGSYQEHDPDEPTLRIKGVAFLGGVDIRERYAGESGRQARKRRRKEKKLREKQQRAEVEGKSRKQLGPK